MGESMDASREFVNPSNQTAYLPLQAGLAQTRWFAGQCRMFIGRNPQASSLPVKGTSLLGPDLGPARRDVSARRNEMHPEELMKPDLFSEIVLLGSGGLIFVSLLLIVAAALTRA